MRKPDFNGPDRELNPDRHDHLEESVYCVNCGNIYVPDPPRRDCPTCTVAAMLKEEDDQ